MRVLIVDAESTFALPVARCLGQRPSVKVFGLSSRPSTSVRFSRYVSRTFIRSPAGDSDIAARICECGFDVRADVLLAADEWVVAILHQHRERFASSFAVAPLPPAPLLDIVSSKATLASLLQQHGIAHPRTVVIAGRHDALAPCASLPFPVLVKPARYRGGSGIALVHDFGLLTAHVAARSQESFPLVVQEYLDGDDYCCNLLCRDGEVLAYTVQKTRMRHGSRFSPGAMIEFVEHAGVLRTAHQFAEATRWSGVANIDLRVAEGQAALLEVNPRFWGTLLGSLHAGVNFPYLTCLAGLGTSFPLPRYGHTIFVPRNKTALSLIARSPRRHAGVKLSATALSYGLRDPLPEIARAARSIARFTTRLLRSRSSPDYSPR
jgi:predicted ATP-grasp superfamily ATP-dependent carboligase